MKKLILSSLLSFIISSFLFATHNTAGEIVFKQIDGLTIEASVITYTNANSVAADRDSLELCWSTGNCETVLRVNGPDVNNNGIPDGELIGPNTKMNIYKKQHTYPGPGHYVLSMTDPNRSGGILNVNFPNSENVPFSIITEFTFLNPAFTGPNSSPVLLQVPMDVAFTGEPFMHSPNAFDIDGDSIAYELTTPVAVPNYDPIEEVGSGPNNTVTMNEETGLLIWDAPQVQGLYTIAYLIKSYRNGEEIDRIIRDMQIEVTEGPGFTPDVTIANITGNEEIILVNLGDTISLDISANDQDANQELAITTTCGLFDFFNNTATFNTSVSGNSGTATFEWIVQEEHLRQQPYQLVVKVEDNTPGHFKTKLAVVRFRTNAIITGIPETLASHGIKLFPNPVTEGYLNLDFKNQEGFSKQYAIFNSLGQQVEQGLINADLETIKVKALAKGTYHLRIEDGETSLISSFVVQ